LSGKKTSKKKTPPRKKALGRPKPKTKAKLAFHTPFEEFSIPSLEDLLGLIDRTKPADAVVEVSPVQDTPHVVCMLPLTHIVVHSPEASSIETERVYAMYQYCPHCKLGVRVL
jgi:hypothetical protein